MVALTVKKDNEVVAYPQNAPVKFLLAGDLDYTSRKIASKSRAIQPYVPTEGGVNVISAETSLNAYLVAGLEFPYFDFTYGVQDTLQADYQTFTPMGSPEGIHVYNATNNRVIEFMIRMFTERAQDVKEHHNKFCALQALVLPWLDVFTQKVLPPPKLKLIISNNVYATGFLNSITTTHYDPVTEIKIGNSVNAKWIKVIEFIEVVVSFTRQALIGQMLPYGNAVGFVDGHMIGFGGIQTAQIP